MSSTTTSHDSHAGHQDHDSPEYIRKSVRKYLVIGGLLYVLTVVTVVISWIDLPTPGAIALGMAVAASKASLVALFFMHLIDEKKLIYYTLLLTVIFFAVCMIVPAVTDTEAATHRTVYERPAKEEKHSKEGAHGKATEGDHGKPAGEHH